MISPKVDIWSVAIVFYYLLYGSKPFDKIIKKNDSNAME